MIPPIHSHPVQPPFLDNTPPTPLILSKPKISSPEHFAITFARAMDGVHEAAQTTAKNLLALMRNSTEEFKSNLLKSSEAIERHAKAAASLDTWEQLGDLAEYILSTISMALGGTLLMASEPILGGCLIAFGALGIFNKLADRVGIWDAIANQLTSDREQKEWIAQTLPTAIGITCTIANALGTGFFGSLAFGSGQVAFFNQFRNVTSGVLNLGVATNKSHREIEKATMDWTQDNNDVIQNTLDTNQELVMRVLSTIQEVARKSHSVVSSDSAILGRIVRA